MFNIQRIDFKNKNAKNDFFTSFQNTGFAVIENHDISFDLIDSVYSEWEKFFSSEEKINYKFDSNTQDGFFPFRSESAKDNPVKDLKEFFHVYPNTILPDFASLNTKSLYKDLVSLGNVLLNWLDELTPADVKNQFSEPLFNMSKGSDRNLLRILHYPPLESKVEDGAIRAAAHEDINLITLLVAGTKPGLEAQDKNGNWHEISTDPGTIIVNIGDMLEEVSGGYYPSTTHRVVNPFSDINNNSRYSMPLFLHPRDEVKLSNKYTASSYLKERLLEIGLKS